MLCNYSVPARLSLGVLHSPDPCNAVTGCSAKVQHVQCCHWMLCTALTTAMLPPDALIDMATAMVPLDALQRHDPCNATHWILWMFIVLRIIGDTFKLCLNSGIYSAQISAHWVSHEWTISYLAPCLRESCACSRRSSFRYQLSHG